MDGSGAHFDAKMAKETTTAEPLCVLPTEMSPFGVPSEKSLLERGQVRGRGLSDTLEGEGLGGRKDVVEPANHRQRGLSMISNSDAIAVGMIKVRAVPFKDVLPSLVLAKENLRTEESNLESRKVVSLAFKNGNVAKVIENLVT
jgi:hypothetical protein